MAFVKIYCKRVRLLKYTRPDFYDKFHCIAGKCTDTCCKGWDIDIDEQTLSLYHSDSTDFGRKLTSCIASEDKTYSFKTSEDGRCPFLNSGNLCEIIINKGEDYLCDICREHPRFHNWLPSVREDGLGICCEEVCRILLTDSNPIEFVHGEDCENSDSEFDRDDCTYCDFLLNERDKVFGIIRDCDKPFDEREKILLESVGSSTDLNAVKCEFLDFMSTLEPIDGTWIPLIERLKAFGSQDLQIDVRECMSDTERTNLLIYFIYRYYINAIYDGDVAARVNFSVFSLWFIELCCLEEYGRKGTLPLQSRINIVKNYSKQVEYCEENVERLTEMSSDLLACE